MATMLPITKQEATFTCWEGYLQITSALGNPTQIPAADAKNSPANPTVEKLVKDIKQKYDAEKCC